MMPMESKSNNVDCFVCDEPINGAGYCMNLACKLGGVLIRKRENIRSKLQPESTILEPLSEAKAEQSTDTRVETQTDTGADTKIASNLTQPILDTVAIAKESNAWVVEQMRKKMNQGNRHDITLVAALTSTPVLAKLVSRAHGYRDCMAVHLNRELTLEEYRQFTRGIDLILAAINKR